jgi:hypothetical protein
LFFGAVKCWATQLVKEHKLRRICYSEFPYIKDNQFICTELADEIWFLVGRAIIPVGVPALPSGYKDAYLTDKLIIVGSNNNGVSVL